MSISQSHKSTPTKVTTKSLKTLSEIVKIPSTDQSLVGVVLDATGNYKTDDSFDYVCKIKIIDKDFNPSKNIKIQDKVNPYIMIFIFTQKLKDSPVITKIGDIILLRHFNFDTYQDIVKGIHKRNKSNWYIFDALESNNNFQPIIGTTLQNFTISADEKKRIQQMRQFSKHFFSNQNLLNLSWYESSLPVNMKTNTVYELKDIDLLVKVVSCVEFIVDRNTYFKVAFVDQQKRIYLSELINVYGFNQLQKDTVLKLRSVRIQLVNNSYRIDFYDYSDILIVPSHFLNAKLIQQETKDITYTEMKLEDQFLQDFHLEKYDKEQIGQNTFIFKQTDHASSNTLMQLKQTYAILDDFNINTNLDIKEDQEVKDFYGSLIKNEHQYLSYSTLKDLNKLLQQHKHSKNLGPQADFEKVFRVKVNISKIKFTNYEDCIQLLCTKTDKIIRLDMKNKNQKNLKPIIYNIFSLKDTLSKAKMPVYLFTQDGNPNFIFDLWGTLPSFSEIKNFTKKNKNLQEFSKQLKKLQSSDQQFELCLQLLKTQKGNCFFRIIDSIFWFV